MTVRAFRPRSSVPTLNLSSSSMTSKGMMTSLSANMNSALGLCSRTLVSSTKCLLWLLLIVRLCRYVPVPAEIQAALGREDLGRPETRDGARQSTPARQAHRRELGDLRFPPRRG